MTDGHIHIERGPYTLDWIDRFVEAAVKTQTDEIGLLEHSYRFEEFLPMYTSVRAHSDYIDQWLHRKGGAASLDAYLKLIGRVREISYPVSVKFGIEVCYFEDYEGFVSDILRDRGLDFAVGSVHFVDGFAFDHKSEHWNGADVDTVYRRFFETSVKLADCGVYDGLAHPDSIKLYGHRPSFPLKAYYDRLAKSLAESGMYAEQNSGVYRRCAPTVALGMDAELIRSLKAHGVRLVSASDAHCPEDVGTYVAEALRLVEQA
ncbi:MAG: PHP domain-containing protein [Clostridiaceae bacterium]|nr:PHP domain-containing protein [Eubacteriales bacterium]